MNRAPAVSLLLASLALAGCAQERKAPPRGTLVVSQEQQASWVRNFNPLAPGGAQRCATSWKKIKNIY